MAIKLSPFFGKLILRLNRFHRILVVRKGYNEDYGNFTELVWADDRRLEFHDRKIYPEFQLWIL
jgi:hypothetical protein